MGLIDRILAFFYHVTTIQTLLTSRGSFGAPENALFDYIVVGGGNAGLTVAARLAANPSVSVAVIEAGGFYEQDAGNISVVPATCTYYAGTSPEDTQPLVDWSFNTVPQKGAGDRTLHYARGKTLGGSSARNYLLYHRPTVGSLEKWATEVGDSSYTFDNFLPYYKHGIHYTPPNQIVFNNMTVTSDPSAFAASSGSLQISYNNAADAFHSWAQEAFEAEGLQPIDGFNSGRLLGSAVGTFTIDPSNAHRSSSESSYMQEAMETTSLVVYKNTMALKILFSASKTAEGVLVSSTNNTAPYVLSARKEIILSAGAFQSPQLLMVSGVGPKNLLRKFDIPVIKDLPGVGQNLQDQPWFGSSQQVNVLTASAILSSPEALSAAEEQYQKSANGPLSTSSGGVFAWEKLPSTYRSRLSPSAISALSQFPADWPEIEFLPVSAYLGNVSNSRTSDPKDGHNYATIATCLTAPLSRGNISINSSSMLDAPLINPNWLTDAVDQEVAIAAFKRQRDIWARLKHLGVTLDSNGVETIFPATNSTKTDAQILSWIQSAVAPIWHAAGTCKMGKSPDLDPTAVIDHRARVYGVKNLRVVDASSFPFLPPGHPQSTVYALAWKIADDILNETCMSS